MTRPTDITPAEQREVAVQISHVSKEYRLGQLGGGTLNKDIQSWWARVRGKEDPNSLLGAGTGYTGDRFLALDDINLTIYKGEALGLIGHNGAGKSTLLKLLSQVTAPSKGEIDIYGRVASMLEVGTGFHGEMTGRENVYMNGSILGMTRAEIDRKMEQIIDFSECRRFIDTPVKRYSSGMYVKLAFSVAAHLDNEIMIMDEVLAVGDAVFRDKCLKKMQQEAGRGRTIIYVSHNMATVRQLCDRCAVLRDGKLIYLGDIEKAIELYLDSILDTNTSRDLSDVPRDPSLIDQRMKCLFAEYIGKDSIEFGDDEPLRIHLIWENLADYEGLCLRVGVYTAEDIVQASGTLYDIADGRAGEKGELTFEMDVSRFAPATYKIKLRFFFRDVAGNPSDTDRVDALFFERSSANDEHWDISHYGYLRLEGLRIIES